MQCAELDYLRNTSGCELIKDYTKTAILCSLILASSPTQDVGCCNPTNFIYRDSKGSDFFRIASLISSQNTTWSSVSMYSSAYSCHNENITSSVKLLKQLSFLEGDVQAEKEADAYFNSIPVKTRKVLILNKS